MVRRFLYLSGLAIFAVVLNHSVGQVFVAMFYWTDQYRPGVGVPNFDQIGSAAYYILRMMEQLAIFGVPAFVFISGYFIAFATPRARSTVPWSIIWGRIKNLGIPFLLWSVVYLLINMLLFVRENKPVDGYSLGGVLAALRSEYTLWEIVVQVITGRTTPAFYYIPILIQLYIISPLLIPLAKKHWKLLLIVAALLHIFIVGVLRYPQIIQMEVRYFQFFDLLNKSWVFPGFLLWFVLGIIVGFHLPSFKPILVKARWFLLAGLVSLFIIGLVEWEVLFQYSGEAWINPRETVIDNLYALVFILVFVAFEKVKLPSALQISNVGIKSYGVYLVHSLVLLITSKVIYNLAPTLLAFPFIYLLILVVTGLGVPLVLMGLVNKLPLRRYYEYIFG